MNNIFIDWLQFKGLFMPDEQPELKETTINDYSKKTFDENLNTIYKRKKNYLQFTKLNYGTKTFKTIIDVFIFCNKLNEIRRFGTITKDFRLNCKNKIELLKIENSILYEYSINEIYEITKEFFKINEIVRIDLCIDIQTFKNNYNCERFINDCYNNVNIKTYGSKKTKYVIEQTQIIEKNKIIKNGLVPETLTHGSRNSLVMCTLYNKTKELNKSGKDYIQKIHNKLYGNNLDVWRLEFAIMKPREILYKNKKISNLRFNKIDLKELFISILNKYYLFKTNDTRRKQKKIKLLDLQTFREIDNIKFDKRIKREVKRSDKTFYDNLEKLNNEMRQRTDKAQTLHEAKKYYAITRNLLNYANRKYKLVINDTYKQSIINFEFRE